jgi:transcriptional regulator with XRE-family HTH domain
MQIHKKLRIGDQKLISEKTGLTQRWVNKVLTGKTVKVTESTRKVENIAKQLVRNRTQFLKSA